MLLLSSCQDVVFFLINVVQGLIDLGHWAFPYKVAQLILEKSSSFPNRNENELSYLEHQRSMRCKATYLPLSDQGFVSLLFSIRQYTSWYLESFKAMNDS